MAKWVDHKGGFWTREHREGLEATVKRVCYEYHWSVRRCGSPLQEGICPSLRIAKTTALYAMREAARLAGQKAA